MFEQVLNPAGHLWLSVLISLVPLIALLFMLAVLRMTAWLATILVGVITIPLGVSGLARAARRHAQIVFIWRTHGILGD